MKIDDRLPTYIQDFISSNEENAAISFLSFNDWLLKKENQSNDWIVVARSGRTNNNGNTIKYHTMSCIVEMDDDARKKFLSKSSWYINSEFGIPHKYQTPYEGEEYDDGLIAKKQGVTYKPFVFTRYYKNRRPDHFQIIEHFLLYYDCFWVEEKKEYQSVGNNGEYITVVKIRKNEDEEVIEVDAHTLREYLAVRKSYLARFHDHLRQTVDDTLDFPLVNREYDFGDKASYFKLYFWGDNMLGSRDITGTARICGKDIINPYKKPQSHNMLDAIKRKKYLEFIIKRGENGEEIECTCNPDGLSDFYTDRGTPNMYSSVYFKKELLLKYYAEPGKYKVSDYSVKYTNFWDIDICITEEDLVQVFLKDLGERLPYEEMLHWRQYNVPPKGTMTDYRFKVDFCADPFAEPSLEEATITHFNNAFDSIQSSFEESVGRKLFLPLRDDDKYLQKILHVPLTEEYRELDEQLLAVAKIIVDSFDNKTLKNLTGKKIGGIGSGGEEIKGKTGLFYEYLIQIINDEDSRNEIIEPFNIIQALRSSSAAHRKSKELEKKLLKYDFNGMTKEDIFRTILLKLIKSLNAISNLMKAMQT